jgi:hypothetical protein
MRQIIVLQLCLLEPKGAVFQEDFNCPVRFLFMSAGYAYFVSSALCYWRHPI